MTEYPQQVYQVLELAESWTPINDVPENLSTAVEFCLSSSLAFRQRFAPHHPYHRLPEGYSGPRVTSVIEAYWQLGLLDPGKAALALHRIARTAATTKEGKKPAVETLLGEDSGEILKIAGSKKSTDTRMREICRLDRRHVGWNSPRWADLLDVSEGAVRKTPFWKELRKQGIF